MNNILRKIVLLATVGMIITSCGNKANDKPNNTDVKPVIGLTSVSQITSTSATVDVVMTSSGSTPITDQGIERNGVKIKATTINSNGFNSVILDLNSGSDVTVKAYATNSVGTSYGLTVTFKTSPPLPTITDIDGNSYPYVVEGTQTWTIQPLKVKHYLNGNAITNVTDNVAWSNLRSGAWCNFNNDATQGVLYNLLAATDSRGISPNGWHVATRADWVILRAYLGGDSGGKMKEPGTAHWSTPNYSSGSNDFNLLPTGRRDISGSFTNMGKEARFLATVLPGGQIFLLNFDQLSSTFEVLSETDGFAILLVKN